MNDSEQYSPGALVMPAGSAIAVTPSDSTDLSHTSRALICDVGGTVAVDMVDTGTNISFTLVAGIPLSIRAKRVRATGTTATGIKAMY